MVEQEFKTIDISKTIEFIKNIYTKGYLIGPIKCKCGSQNFNIYKDSSYKINGCSFSCSNYKCKKKYPITINSFFDKFSHQNIMLIAEIMKCFLCLDLNAKRCLEYIIKNLNYFVSERTVRNVYTEMRKIITKYLKILYQSERLGYKDLHKNFSVDESLINHSENRKIWLLGACDNETKEFRIEAAYTRDTATLKEFINTFIEPGNNIITDGWAGYNFLDQPNSGYIRYAHNHGGGNFGLGFESTSHVESIWSQVKAKIKENYHIFPYKVFMRFVREIEFKIRIRSLNFDKKIDKFFECYKLCNQIEDSALKSENSIFLDDDLKSDSDNEED